jgi:hypothetical protein
VTGTGTKRNDSRWGATAARAAHSGSALKRSDSQSRRVTPADLLDKIKPELRGMHANVHQNAVEEAFALPVLPEVSLGDASLHGPGEPHPTQLGKVLVALHRI